MIEQMQDRLTELRREYQQGEGQFRELTRQEAALREMLLRISGAIQVLEELTTVTTEEAGGGRSQAPEDGNETDDRPGVLTVP